MINKKWSKRQRRFLWGYDVRVPSPGGGTTRLRPYEFESKREAQAALNDLLRRIDQAEHGIAATTSKPLLRDLIANRLDGLTVRNEKTRSARVLIGWLALLDASVDPTERDIAKVQSAFPVVGLDTPKIRLWWKKRSDEGLALTSIHREITIIAATLHEADQHFPELAQWRPPRIPYPKRPKSRRETIITDEQYQALLACLLRPPGPLDGDRQGDQKQAYEARIRVAQILRVAMMTAMRHGEIMKLKWTDIDWRNGRLLVRQGKTDRYKQIPLTSTLREIIEARQQSHSASPYIFSKGGNIYPRFYKALREACDLCGIPYGKKVADGLVLHLARHTVTTRLVSDGLDFDTVSQITGHGSRELLLHYQHHQPGSLARAAASLEKLGGVDTNGQK